MSDGTEKSENGEFVKSDDTENGIMRVKGYYSYVSPDGNNQYIRYTADEKGFQPLTVRKSSQMEKQSPFQSVFDKSSSTMFNENVEIPHMSKNKMKIKGL